jgi:5'-3' exonuclease
LQAAVTQKAGLIMRIFVMKTFMMMIGLFVFSVFRFVARLNRMAEMRVQRGIVYHHNAALTTFMDVYLIDGTYELFRHFFAVPSSTDAKGQEIGATRGVVASVLSMIEGGATHLGVATDHVVESFRNDLYPGYKTSEGVAPKLLSQFPIVEEALAALGVVVWPMIEFEADDALSSAAAKAAQNERVGKVFICTPDKDLAQSVVGTRVVQIDRRREVVRDEAGVVEKFGVQPQSIPDYLALVGDSADGFPGISGWGAKAAASVLSRYSNLENIPKDSQKWDASIRRARPLAESLFAAWDDALLFRKLATLRLDVPVFESVDDLRWKGPQPNFEQFCNRMKAPELFRRATSACSAATAKNAARKLIAG